MASPSPDRFSRLRSPSDEFCPPLRLLLACGSHFWGCCPLCHIWFQVPPADAFAPVLPSPLLGSVGSFGSGAVVSGLSSGPSVVASRGSIL